MSEWKHFKDSWPDEDKPLWVWSPGNDFEKLTFIPAFGVLPGFYEDSDWQWQYANPPKAPE